MSAALPSSPAEMRAYIVERLVGETGEPERVTEAARGLVEKAIPPIRERLKQGLALDLAVELATVELARMADARPEGLGHAMAVVTAEAADELRSASADSSTSRFSSRMACRYVVPDLGSPMWRWMTGVMTRRPEAEFAVPFGPSCRLATPCPPA